MPSWQGCGFILAARASVGSEPSHVTRVKGCKITEKCTSFTFELPRPPHQFVWQELREDQKKVVAAERIGEDQRRGCAWEFGSLPQESLEMAMHVRAVGKIDEGGLTIVEDLVCLLDKDKKFRQADKELLHSVQCHRAEETLPPLDDITGDCMEGCEMLMSMSRDSKLLHSSVSLNRKGLPLQPIQPPETSRREGGGASGGLPPQNHSRRRKREPASNMWPSYATPRLEDASAGCDLLRTALTANLLQQNVPSAETIAVAYHGGAHGARGSGRCAGEEIRGTLACCEPQTLPDLNKCGLFKGESSAHWGPMEGSRDGNMQEWEGKGRSVKSGEVENIFGKVEMEEWVDDARVLDSDMMARRNLLSEVIPFSKKRLSRKWTKTFLPRDFFVGCTHTDLAPLQVADAGSMAVAQKVVLEGIPSADLSTAMKDVAGLMSGSSSAELRKSCKQSELSLQPWESCPDAGSANIRNDSRVWSGGRASLWCREDLRPEMWSPHISQGWEGGGAWGEATLHLLLPKSFPLLQSGLFGSDANTLRRMESFSISSNRLAEVTLGDRSESLLDLSSELPCVISSPVVAMSGHSEVALVTSQEGSANVTSPGVTCASDKTQVFKSGVSMTASPSGGKVWLPLSAELLESTIVMVESGVVPLLGQIQAPLGTFDYGDANLVSLADVELAAGPPSSGAPSLMLENIAKGIATAFSGGSAHGEKAAGAQSSETEFSGLGGKDSDGDWRTGSKTKERDKTCFSDGPDEWRLGHLWERPGEGGVIGADFGSDWAAIGVVESAQDLSSVAQEEVRALLEGREPASLMEGVAGLFGKSPPCVVWSNLGEGVLQGVGCNDDMNELREIVTKRIAVERGMANDVGGAEAVGAREGFMGLEQVSRGEEMQVGEEGLTPLQEVITIDLSRTRLQNWDFTSLMPWSPRVIVVLDLSHNILRSLPDELDRFQGLQHIDMQANQLRTLPESIGTLTKLRYLNLQQNRIDRIPDSIGFCTSLESLHLDCNKLRALPDTMQHLQKLKVLTFALNKMPGLPDWLGTLTALVELDSHYNLIRTIPSSLGNLSSLERLNLSYNFTALKMLPPAVGLLTELKFLNLGYNHIERLPLELGHLTVLESLELNGNSLEDPPPHIVRCGARAVVLYLAEKSRRQEQEAESLVDDDLDGDCERFSCLPVIVAVTAMTAHSWLCVRDAAFVIGSRVRRGFEAWSYHHNIASALSRSMPPIQSLPTTLEPFLYAEGNSNSKTIQSPHLQETTTLRTPKSWETATACPPPQKKGNSTITPSLSQEAMAWPSGERLHIPASRIPAEVAAGSVGLVRNMSLGKVSANLVLGGPASMEDGAGTMMIRRPGSLRSANSFAPSSQALLAAPDSTMGESSPRDGPSSFLKEPLERGSMAEGVISSYFVGSPQKKGLRSVYGAFLGDVSSSLGLPRASPRRHQWSEEGAPIHAFEDNIFPSTQRDNLYGMMEAQRRVEVRTIPTPPLLHTLSWKGKKSNSASDPSCFLRRYVSNGMQIMGERGNCRTGNRSFVGDSSLAEAGGKSAFGAVGQGQNQRHRINGSALDSGMRRVSAGLTSSPSRSGGFRGRGGGAGGGSSNWVRFPNPNCNYLYEKHCANDVGGGEGESSGERRSLRQVRQGGSHPPPTIPRKSWSMRGVLAPHAGF